MKNSVDSPADQPSANSVNLTKSESKENFSIRVPIISILGGPGSGKGTQCEKLKKKYHFTHISTGDLMRAEVKKGSSVGRLAAKNMKEGCLVDSNVVLKLLRATIKENLASSPGFILDGYPRSLEQLEAFEKSICPITAYIYLQVSDEVMLTRLINRSKQSGRADDNEETVKNRLDVFHRETQPILSACQAKLETIDAEQSIDEVSSVVNAIFSKHVTNNSRNVV